MAAEGKTKRNFVGGAWVEAAAGETFESIDPATGELVGVFPASSAADMDRAVDAARGATAIIRATDVDDTIRFANGAALDFYTEWKALYVDYSGRLQRAQIDNT